MAEWFVVMETGIRHHNMTAGERHKKPVLICGAWGQKDTGLTFSCRGQQAESAGGADSLLQVHTMTVSPSNTIKCSLKALAPLLLIKPPHLGISLIDSPGQPPGPALSECQSSGSAK